LKSKRYFYLCCMGYYCIFSLYLILVHIYLQSDSVQSFKDIVITLSVWLLTMILAVRFDLLWLSFGLHQKLYGKTTFDRNPIKSQKKFYLTVFFYYIFFFLVPAILFFMREYLNIYLLYYLIFLYASVVMKNFDYIFPSYKRYKRLVEQEKFNIIV
jgi:hypothetical protein